MSYQQPPGRNASSPPAGPYPDQNGFQAVRRRDGVQAYVPGPRPHGHRAPRRQQNRKARSALIGVGALVAIIAVIVAATSHNSPSAGNLAARSTASATPAQAVPASTSPIDDWCNGSGYSDYQAVQSDLTRIAADIGNGGRGTEENTDARQLLGDARTAEQNPPPVTGSKKLDYIRYMGVVAFSAADLNSGNISAAGRALNGSAGYWDKVDAIVAACG
jgi:hypothetical protein